MKKPRGSAKTRGWTITTPGNAVSIICKFLFPATVITALDINSVIPRTPLLRRVSIISSWRSAVPTTSVILSAGAASALESKDPYTTRNFTLSTSFFTRLSPYRQKMAMRMGQPKPLVSS